MDYFNNVLTTFVGLKCVSCIAVGGGSESSQNFIKNILKHPYYGFLKITIHAVCNTAISE